MFALNFYILNIELGISFLKNCKGNPCEVNAAIISIGSGLFESLQKLREGNMNLVKMCAYAAAISRVNLMLRQMIKFQNI